jgi:hypothetical protein
MEQKENLPPLNSYAVFNHIYHILSSDLDFTSLVKVKSDANFNSIYTKRDESVNNVNHDEFKHNLLNYANNLSFINNQSKSNFKSTGIINLEWLNNENTGCKGNWSDIKKSEHKDDKKKLTLHNMFNKKGCGEYLEVAPEIVNAVKEFEKREPTISHRKGGTLKEEEAETKSPLQNTDNSLTSLSDIPIYFILKTAFNANMAHATSIVYFKNKFYSFGIGGLGKHAVIFGIDQCGFNNLYREHITDVTYFRHFPFIGFSIVDIGILTSKHIESMTDLIKNVDECLVDFCISDPQDETNNFNYRISNFQYVLKNDYALVCPLVKSSEKKMSKRINCTSSINFIFKDTIDCAGDHHSKNEQNINITPSFWIYKSITSIVTEVLTIPGACHRKYIDDWGPVSFELIDQIIKSNFNELIIPDERYSEDQPLSLDGTVYMFRKILEDNEIDKEREKSLLQKNVEYIPVNRITKNIGIGGSRHTKKSKRSKKSKNNRETRKIGK